jgi:hypothetical protein
MIRKYLLGELTAEDSSKVEEQLLTDDAFYQELLVVEDELIDSYVSEKLLGAEVRGFESHFLTSAERYEKLRFARNLKKYVSQAAVSRPEEAAIADLPQSDQKVSLATGKRSVFSVFQFKNPILAYAFGTVTIAVLAVGLVLIINNLRKSSPQGPGRILAVQLTSGMSRGVTEIKTISIPAGTDTVQLELRIDATGQYRGYAAVLQALDGLEKFKNDSLTARTLGVGGVVDFQVPAALLNQANYSVKLSGVNQTGQLENLGRYSFRVTP